MKKILIIVLSVFLLCGCSSISDDTSTSDTSTTSTSDKVEDGDIVKIDYVGYLDGEAFDGGSYNGYLLEIGSDTFIDGFEDQIIGMKAGETQTITVTFPSTYGSTTINGETVSLANQEVEFEVSVNHIYREVK